MAGPAAALPAGLCTWRARSSGCVHPLAHSALPLLPPRSATPQGAGSRVVATMAKKSGAWGGRGLRRAGRALHGKRERRRRVLPVSPSLRRPPHNTACSRAIDSAANGC